MAAVAEAQARLNVCLRDIITFFEEGGLHEHSSNLLNEYIDKHLSIDFLVLSESYGECMAFVDHDVLISKLSQGWNLLYDGYSIERKVVSKRVKALKEDKKTDPAFLQKQENILLDLDEKKATVLVNATRYRAMQTMSFKSFRENPYFDFRSKHKESIAAKLVKPTK